MVMWQNPLDFDPDDTGIALGLTALARARGLGWPDAKNLRARELYRAKRPIREERNDFSAYRSFADIVGRRS